MHATVFGVGMFMTHAPQSMVTSFDWLKSANWRIINDTVMGGESRSTLSIRRDHLNFSGYLSLKNNGGFASVRAYFSPIEKQNNAIKINVKGDSKVYQLRLRVDKYFDGPAFVAEFKPTTSWQELVFTAKDFSLMYRGAPFHSTYQLKFKDITTLGFLISKKQQGSFNLDIKGITFINNE